MTEKQEYILAVITSIRTAMPFRIQCYRFANVLETIFPEGEIYYNSNHCITKIGDDFYDIDGLVKLDEDHRFKPLNSTYGKRIVDLLKNAKEGYYKSRVLEYIDQNIQL
jgi:hypothetical protein